MPLRKIKKHRLNNDIKENILKILKKEFGRIQIRRILKVTVTAFVFEFIFFISYFSYLDFKVSAATDQAIKQTAASSAPAANNLSLVDLKKPYIKQDESVLKHERRDGDPQEAEIIPGEIIVKFKTSQKADEAVSGKKTAKGAVDIASAPDLKNKFEKHKISKAERISKKKDAKNKSDDRDKKVKLKSDGATKEETEKTIEDLKNDPNVEYAEPNYIMKTQMVPSDPYYSTSGAWGQNFRDLWGLQNISAETAWDAIQGEGVVAAVSDTGVDYNHEDIAQNIWTNAGEIGTDAQGRDKKSNGIDDDGNGYIDDWHGWDFVTIDGTPADNDPMDDNGHGTHVAGTIAATGNNNLGIIGVAPKAKIMPLKGLGIDGGLISDLVDTIYYAADNGAQIINCSWGGYGRTSKALIDAINYAHDVKGVTIVAAAGNSDYDVGTESYGFYPANIKNVITVSAINHTDAKASFSNYGLKIDVAAPGGGDIDQSGLIPMPIYSILSLKSSSSLAIFDSYIVGGNYLRLGGTSMAAPHAAGAAALIKSLHPDFTPEQIRQTLRVSADDIGGIGFDLSSGAGRINVLKAVQTNSLSLIQAKISSPFNKTLKTNQSSITVSGTASGSEFDHYQLFYAVDSGSNSISWMPLDQSISSPVDNGNLGTLPISSLKRGFYYLQLVVVSRNGFQSQDFTRFAIDNPFAPIANDPALNEYSPRISENRIVWTSFPPVPSFNGDVWLNDLTDNSKTQITNHPNAQQSPDISGDFVVWEDYRNIPIGTDMIASCFNRLPSFSTDIIYPLCDSDIYLYDIATKEEIRITNDSEPEITPVISGDRIVWLKLIYYDNLHEGFAYLSTQIWSCVYDRNTKICPAEMITDGSYPTDNIAISGDRIVATGHEIWFGWPSIYAVDAITKKIQYVVGGGSYFDEAAISGDYAVISDVWPVRGVSWPSLYLYDFKTNNSQIIDKGGTAYNPSISGNNIVWYEWDPASKSYQIYFYNIISGQKKQITNSIDFQAYPTISGNRIAWNEWTADSAYSNVDIYTAIIDQDPPIMSITSPLDKAYINGSTVVQVNVSDASEIRKVEFYKDGNSSSFSVDTSAPFEASLVNLPEGLHTFKAVAYDTWDNFTSSEIAVTVDRTIPVMNISSPINLSAVRGIVSVKASASDNYGVKGIEFYIDSQLGGYDAESPYVFLWDTKELLNDSGHLITAKAYDLAGNISYLASASFRIDVQSPVASITNPKNNDTVDGLVILGAYATDNHRVEKVEFYVDDSIIATDADISGTAYYTHQYKGNWDTSLLDKETSHVIYAKALDKAGNFTVSPSVSVTIKDKDIEAPVILQNIKLDSYIKGRNEFSVAASDNIGIAKMELYMDNAFLGSINTAPYVFSLDTALRTGGAHTLYVKVYDSAGNATKASSVNTFIDNYSPSVPGNFSTVLTTSLQPYLKWKASSDNGAIAGYKIYRDNQNIASVLSTALDYTDAAVSSGNSYSYSISSIDAAGNESAKSNSISVNIVSAPVDQNANSSLPLIQNTNANSSVSQNINSSLPLIQNANFNANISINRNTNISISNNANIGSRNNANANQGGVANNNTGNSANANSNAFKDITPPMVSVINPVSNGKVAKKSIISLKAAATDDTKVEKVEFYANGRLACSDSSAEYSCDWKVSAPGNPAYDIQAKAYDTAGNARESEIIQLFLKQDSGVIVSGTGGIEPIIKILRTDGSEIRKFLAYEKQFQGGVAVKTADLYNDGTNEIIAAPGKGREPEVRIFNFDGARVEQFLAYGKSFKGGVNIIIADFEGDGSKEIIVSPQSGALQIRVFGKRSGKWKQITPAFSAFPSKIKTGVNIISGDFDGDGKDEIAATPGQGSVSQVKIFGLRGNRIKEVMPQFAPFGNLFKGGINLAAGDVNGDWKDEIIASPASQGSSTIRVFDFYGNGRRRLLIPPFFAFDKNMRSGTNLGTGDFDGDGKSEIIATMADKRQSLVRIFSGNGKNIIQEFNGFEQSSARGIRAESW